MKKFIVSLIALGCFNLFACDFLVSRSLNSPNGLVVKMQAVDSHGDTLPHQLGNPQFIEKVPNVAGAYKATMLSSDTIFANIDGVDARTITALTDLSGLANTEYLLIDDMIMTLTFSSLAGGGCALSVSHPKDNTISTPQKMVDFERSESGASIGTKYYFKREGFENSRLMIEIIGINRTKLER